MMEILKRQQYCQYSWRVDVKDAGGDRVTVKVRTMLLVTGVLMGVTEAMVEVGDGDSDRDIPSVMLATVFEESRRAPCTDQSLK